MVDGFKLGSSQTGIDRFSFYGVYGVQLLRHQRVLALAQILFDGLSVELTPRYAEAMGQLLRSGEGGIGERDGYFHGPTVTLRYDQDNA